MCLFGIMGIMKDPLSLITQLSSIAVLLIGCFLLGLVIPSDPKLKNYRIARRLLAYAYIVLASSDLYHLYTESNIEYTTLTLTLTLFIAFFQAFLFTYAMITLIDYRFMTRKRLWQHTLFIVTIGFIMFVCKFFFTEALFYKILYIGCVVYSLYLIYCWLLFRKEYKKHVSRMDNFYSDNENKRLGWIKHGFYMALGIGILALLSMFSTQFLYSIFTVIYTIFYIYAGIQYINYVNTFHFISATVAVEEDNDSLQSVIDNNLEAKISHWVKTKKYIQNDITLDNLATDLNTNRTYLSRHINSALGCNFKTWIRTLRIEDAKRLLIKEPFIPIGSIGEMVGIADKSSFFRQFMNITGTTPRDYRKKGVVSIKKIEHEHIL